jgi:hypothetical protein
MLLSTFYGILLFTGGAAMDGPTPDSSKFFSSQLSPADQVP